MLNRLLFSSSVVLFITYVCLPGFCADLKSEGERSYADKNYAQASSLLSRYLIDHPEDATAQYYLGCCYVQLKEPEEAIEHFEKAAKLAPKSTVANYSQQEIARLKGALNQSVAELTTKPSASPKSDAAVAVTAVNRQTDDDEKSLQSEYAAKIQQVRDLAQERISVAERTKRDALGELGGSFYRKGYRWSPDTQPVTDEYKRAVDEINQDAERRIAELNLECKSRIDVLEHSAVQSSQAYTNRETVGAARSNPASSNLHVHNYEIEAEVSGNAIPLIASPLSIPAMKKSPKLTSDETANSEKTAI